MTLHIREVAWEHPDSVALRLDQRAELDARYGRPDSEPGPAPTAADVALFLVAYDAETPIGCGGLRALSPDHGEIKRMYAVPAARGTGAAVLVLRGLEDAARARGWTRLVLETGDAQPDAIRFYQREGYDPIPLFGYYLGSDLSKCFGRDL